MFLAANADSHPILELSVILTLLVLASNAWATCPPPSFEFHGQPECVDLAYDSDKITVSNACQHTVLVDQSMQINVNPTPPSGLIPAQTSAEIRGLNTFTLGLDGRLYRVIATVAPVPETCNEPELTPPSEGAE